MLEQQFKHRLFFQEPNKVLLCCTPTKSRTGIQILYKDPRLHMLQAPKQLGELCSFNDSRDRKIASDIFINKTVKVGVMYPKDFREANPVA